MKPAGALKKPGRQRHKSVTEKVGHLRIRKRYTKARQGRSQNITETSNASYRKKRPGTTGSYSHRQ